MPVIRTPEERFENLPGHPFAPHYAELANPEGGTLRLHYVDEGPPGAPPVLMLHGEPTWSYLYRKMIPVLAGAGLRAVAPDHIGFGRSDKLTEKTSYTFERHVGWLRELVQQLDLRNLTLVGQDWGGPIGLGVVAAEPERFARLVLANTMLHTVEASLEGQIEWANWGVGNSQVLLSEYLLSWMTESQRSPDFRAGEIVRGLANVGLPEDAARAYDAGLPEDVVRAYDAPFPDERYKAGMRQFPILIPVTRSDPGSQLNLASWKVLESFERPVLTAFSDGDPATRGWEKIFQRRIPGARGQPHTTIRGAGHFLQEDRGEELAQVVRDFVRRTSP